MKYYIHNAFKSKLNFSPWKNFKSRLYAAFCWWEIEDLQVISLGSILQAAISRTIPMSILYQEKIVMDV